MVWVLEHVVCVCVSLVGGRMIAELEGDPGSTPGVNSKKALQETFIARNSILAEYGVVGFELGYSYPSRFQDVYS